MIFFYWLLLVKNAIQKSRIRETLTLSNIKDISTDTNFKIIFFLWEAPIPSQSLGGEEGGD